MERLADDGWLVTAEDLATGAASAAERYDAVIVCNGHNATPSVPAIPGADGFAGDRIHSHDYRTPERFRDANVLVVGAGPSGFDICGDVAKVANRVQRVYLCNTYVCTHVVVVVVHAFANGLADIAVYPPQPAVVIFFFVSVTIAYTNPRRFSGAV